MKALGISRIGVIGGSFVSLLASGASAQSTRPAAYESHFGSAVAAWSNASMTTSPSGKSFLGAFVDEPVNLTLKDLPPHEYVQLSFDLLTLLTWDGSGHWGYDVGGSTVVGPDWFTVRIADGPLLMADTFSNVPDVSGFKSPTKFQTFPSPVPGDMLPAQTGAITKNSLGYRYVKFNMDAVYHVTLLVPLKTGDVQFQFAALMRDPLKHPRVAVPEEFWGLDHVKVEALSANDVMHPDAKQAEELLTKAIDKSNPQAAFDAYQKLIGAEAGGKKVLHDARGKAGVDWAKVDTQITQLSLPDFTVSSAARRDLAALGSVIEMPLRRGQLNDEDERQDAIQSLLDDLPLTPITDANQRKAAVASRVLEVMGEQ